MRMKTDELRDEINILRGSCNSLDVLWFCIDTLLQINSEHFIDKYFNRLEYFVVVHGSHPISPLKRESYLAVMTIKILYPSKT